jgi:hypothetical protein
MKEPIPVDLSNCSFDEFVSFLFARDVPDKSAKYEPWYYDLETAFDPERICTYYVQLFTSPEILLERFSKEQLEEGFWAIQSPNLDCGAYRLLVDSDLTLEAKAQCVAAMFELFRKLFATEPLDSSVQMWWDSFCYDWHCGNRKRERAGEDLLLQDAMFQTLSNILSLDSEICHRAALHGLGHLHHPDTKGLIARYIEERPLLNKEMKEYALTAAEFKIM